MLSIFRTIAALTATVEQALSIAGIMVLAIANYAGYSIPRSSMKPWFLWISYINPVWSYTVIELTLGVIWFRISYGKWIFKPKCPVCPSGSPISQRRNSKPSLSCNRFRISVVVLTLGAIPGQETVPGARWLELSYGYSHDHLWWNLGIIIAFFIFFTATFLIAVEYKSPPETRGEVLVFPMGKKHEDFIEHEQRPQVLDEETGRTDRGRVDNVMTTRTITGGNVEAMKKELQAQRDVFTWRNVCCDVHIKSETRRLLSNVSGFVKPGTLTALMGESGAGKTTLLDTCV